MADTEAAVHFADGDRVRVSERMPEGHCRTPAYIRGHVGRVSRYLGSFRNPEDLAYFGDGFPKQPLYVVTFRQSELWPDYSDARNDTLQADIYQHWLEPVEDAR